MKLASCHFDNYKINDKVLVQVPKFLKPLVRQYRVLGPYLIKTFHNNRILMVCKNGKQWEVLMKCEDDSETWETLSISWRYDPMTLSKYSEERNLLTTPDWKRF